VAVTNSDHLLAGHAPDDDVDSLFHGEFAGARAQAGANGYKFVTPEEIYGTRRQASGRAQTIPPCTRHTPCDQSWGTPKQSNLAPIQAL
jgi:hypothetical protein